ncbi:Protein FAR1-RELATED SEQUENCE 3 [Acorus calamus]|uniref:Protein FAR1-RELATED SEQUENCE 3 n=1 Tax=Acorus calamus TaxID=4465 RepID=A0AAV9FD32_ACOCL|nr:Protein FAR1-RELATED SEQUENCE 3 [Acorus calamus]
MYDCDAEVRSNCQKGLNLRFNDLCRDAIKYAEEGAASSVSYKVAKYALQKAFTEVLAVKKDACSMDSDLLQGGEAIYSQLRTMLMKDALFHGEL